MLIAEARVETDRPGRYLSQLCQHLSNRGRHLGSGGGRHRPDADHRGRQPDRAEQAQVEWSDTEGQVTFPDGRCVMRASGNALLLRAAAADSATLEFIENLIGGHLGRFSRREPLTVTWHPAGAPAAEPPPGGAVGAGGPAR